MRIFETRPLCEHCGKNPAKQSSRRADGTFGYLKQNGKYTCSGCHKRITIAENLEDLPNWCISKRNGIRRLYIKHRKDYCENQDGRLGFACNYPITNKGQLSVDHIIENFGEEDSDNPENLQTLCHNCHFIKSMFVHTRNHLAIGHMIKTIADSARRPMSDKLMQKMVEKIFQQKENRMKRNNVKSSSVKSVGYDAATSTLEVEFVNGHIYEYAAVPATVYTELQAAASVGTFINEKVRDVFTFQEVKVTAQL